MKIIYHTLCLFFLTNLSFAQNNSFTGTFLNTEIGLTLTLQQNETGLTGQFQLQGESFPIAAKMKNEQTVVGAYPYYGNEVPIQLMKVEANYLLVTEGVTIPMTFTQMQGADNQMVSGSATAVEETDGAAINISTGTPAYSETKATGRSFGDKYAGFRFNLPNDWNGQQIEDGSYLIGHKTKPGFILIMPHQFTDLNTLYQESAQGIQEEGIQLFPSKGITKFGKNGLIADFDGMVQGQRVKAHAIGLLSIYGGGLNMLIAVRTDLYQREYLQIIQSIANSVVFSKPKVAAISRQWKENLMGKRLQYLKTANGFSDKTVIDLCSSGQFRYNSNSSGLSDGLTALTYAGQDAGGGTWKIVSRGRDAILTLSFNNGELYEYKITKRGESGGQINLNGRRFFVTNGVVCN